MSALFGNKNIKDIFFGNKAVTAIYRGSTLVWQRIKKILKDSFVKFECYEIIPKTDITLSSISYLGQHQDTHTKFRLLNEVGICIAYCAENGCEYNVPIYGLTGTLKTSVGLGTITLFANNKYYLNIKGINYDDGMTAAKYDGITSVHKSFNNIANVNGVYSSTAWQHTCVGSANSFSEICQKVPASNGSYFIWKGNSLGNNMMPQESGVGNPYPYLLKRDMSKVKKIFTDSDFSQSDDRARYAFIFYTMGNTPGDEFIMNVGDGYGQGFAVTPGSSTKNVFTNCKHKIYKLSGNMSRNHITSMTPVEVEPDHNDLVLGDIYYKASGVTWGNISNRAVVAWNGTTWEIATDWTTEFMADTNYNATNYCEKIADNMAKDFNLISETTSEKCYFRLNDIEV